LFFTKTTYCNIRPLAAEIFLAARFFSVANRKIFNAPVVPVVVVVVICHPIPRQHLLDCAKAAREKRRMT
jgi:hypothetical protein